MKKILVCLLLVAGFGAPAAFGSIIVGDHDSGNCYMVACGAADAVTRWQEHYAASSFGSSPLLITNFRWFNDSGSGSDTATFDIYFSTAANALGFDSTTMAANVGADNAFFASISYGPSNPAVFTVTGTPFVYDPTAGDLLMDVIRTGTSGTCEYCSFMQADYSPTEVMRNWHSDIYGDNANYDGALVTEFNATSTPEPSTLALSGTALLGLWIARRRNRQ